MCISADYAIMRKESHWTEYHALGNFKFRLWHILPKNIY
jgi:hypothetical protein